MSYKHIAPSPPHPVLYRRPSPGVYFTHSSVHMSTPLSQPIPLPFPLGVHTFLLCVCVSFFLLCKLVHLYHSSRLHIYPVIGANFKNKGFPGGSMVENPPPNAGDMGLISGSWRPPGERNGTPLHYYCQENPMDIGAWWATAHGLMKRVKHKLATKWTTAVPSKAEVLNFWRQHEKKFCLKPQSSLFIVCYLKRVRMFALFYLFLLPVREEEVKKVWFLRQRAFPEWWLISIVCHHGSTVFWLSWQLDSR